MINPHNIKKNVKWKSQMIPRYNKSLLKATHDDGRRYNERTKKPQLN